MRIVSLLLLASAAAFGQIAAPNETGVSMGHLHLNTADVAAQKAFWIGLIGGQPWKLGTIEGAKLPGTVILFKPAAPSGGTEESVINHVGIKVKDLDASMAKLKAANLEFTYNPKTRQAMVTGPDKLRVEFTEDKTMEVPMIFHHIHFYTPSVPDIQSWYAKNFGAKPGRRAKFETADLPGANLTFSPSDKKLAETKGRALDHIGFEVRNLEAFCKSLEASGVKFDVPYRKVPALGIAIAFFTDPFGDYVELTEGLDKL